MLKLLEDAVDFVFQQDLQGDLPPHMYSLRAATVLAGDVVFVPACSLVIEKATKAHNVQARASAYHVHSRTAALLRIYSQAYQARPDLT